MFSLIEDSWILLSTCFHIKSDTISYVRYPGENFTVYCRLSTLYTGENFTATVKKVLTL